MQQSKVYIRKLKRDNDPWFCKYCIKMEIPFSCLLNGKSIIHKKELKTTPTIFDKLSVFSEEEDMGCKY